MAPAGLPTNTNDPKQGTQAATLSAECWESCQLTNQVESSCNATQVQQWQLLTDNID
jgi:hypothetical protein